MTQRRNVRFRIINGVRVEFPFASVAATSLLVRGKCYYLGTPKVLKNCNCYANEDHTCELGEPHAVPGGNCQTCPKWESA